MTRELRIHLITCEITHRSTLSHFSVARINSCAFHATDARNVCDAEGDRAGDISRVKPFIAVERLGPRGFSGCVLAKVLARFFRGWRRRSKKSE